MTIKKSRNINLITVSKVSLLLLLAILAALVLLYWFPRTNNMMLEADIDGNGVKECYLLKNGYLEVTEKEKLFWKAHGDWYVQDIEIADITGNGKPNLILQFMSTDNFASHIPFWHKKREKGLFSHIFIYEYRQGRLKCIWGSSALNRPAVSMEMVDINRENRNDAKEENKRGNVSIEKKLTERGRQNNMKKGLKIKDRQILFEPAIKDLLSRRSLYKTNIWYWDEWGLSIYEGRTTDD